MKRAVRVLVLCLSLVVAAAVGGVIMLYIMNQPTDRIAGEEAIFTVQPGETLGEVAEKLHDEKIIKSDVLFRILGKIYHSGSKMKTGIYRISRGSTSMEVHNLLVSGSQLLFKVTIPEGWTMDMIGSLLEQKGITTAEDFDRACRDPDILSGLGIEESGNAEGFLYPDTYYFVKDYPAEKIVEHMVKTFFSVLDEIDPGWKELERREIHDRVTLASIVEREYRDPSEAPLIASVFYNRLEEGMNLGSCATVVYALTREMGREHPERLTYADLEVESPYNTYRNDGLPPGPIANPGFVALDAVFHPEESTYLYFVLKDPEAGRHYFSRSLGEHNQAYTLYIKRSY